VVTVSGIQVATGTDKDNYQLTRDSTTVTASVLARTEIQALVPTLPTLPAPLAPVSVAPPAPVLDLALPSLGGTGSGGNPDIGIALSGDASAPAGGGQAGAVGTRSNVEVSTVRTPTAQQGGLVTVQVALLETTPGHVLSD
jgi:hypothetical protein